MKYKYSIIFLTLLVCQSIFATSTELNTTDNNLQVDAVCIDLVLSLDESGFAYVYGQDLASGSTSSAGEIVNYIVDQSELNCFYIGTNPINVTVLDDQGNQGTCVSYITLIDEFEPEITCQEFLSVQLDCFGAASLTPSDLVLESFDNCSETDIDHSQLEFTYNDIGIVTVLSSATDHSGNVATCMTEVVVNGSGIPSAQCQDITVELDQFGSVNIQPEDIDNGTFSQCGVETMILDRNDFSIADLGDNFVILTVVEANTGNTSTCSAIVTVIDAIAPNAICQDMTISLDDFGSASISAQDVDGGSTDNSFVTSLTVNEANFDCSHVGINNVLLTVMDNSGNTNTCAAAIHVEDITAPNTVELNDVSVLRFETVPVPEPVEDNCTGLVSATTTDPLSYQVEGTYTVTWNYEDESGNLASVNQNVIVTSEIDTEAPNAVCQNMTLSLDATGSVSFSSLDIDGGSTDNETITSITTDQTQFDCSHLGSNTVTLTVVDEASNVATCAATVLVEDSMDPTMFCQDMTVQLNEIGIATITLEDIDNGSVDNCFMILDASQMDFDESHVGINTVILTGTDISGNTGSCIANVEVLEFPSTPPHEQAVAFTHPNEEEYEPQDGIQHGEIQTSGDVRGVQEISMSLFPNPSFDGYTTVVLKDMADKDNEVTIMLYDAAGTAIRYERRIIQGTQAKIKVDGLEAYVTGMYTIQVLLDGRTYSQPLVIR